MLSSQSDVETAALLILKLRELSPSAMPVVSKTVVCMLSSSSPSKSEEYPGM